MGILPFAARLSQREFGRCPPTGGSRFILRNESVEELIRPSGWRNAAAPMCTGKGGWAALLDGES
jgi:hypothetical protein